MLLAVPTVVARCFVCCALLSVCYCRSELILLGLQGPGDEGLAQLGFDVN